ncbi:hypothetical protein BCR42DRAFT_426139 [Absidia repens]|uniref:Uncharacterized protein n=1 Tax=Absidia repens TaxID=90262 RepID=A0A1X2I1I1_9FUNG|nr:hypothetical protein BCR42DRAFT_426139 [Absidia repens]
MKFLNDLFVDWSSRVWVISEYHIAKKKNNLKYWFIGIATYELRRLPFLEFDFLDSTSSSAGRNAELDIGQPSSIYLKFHGMMTRQLVDQCFFEMMLCGKASKIEDRFYAILPQSKYKDKINQVTHWKISNMVSVKLKLFEIMDTKDKLTLLFLAGCQEISFSTDPVLPTFATSTIFKSTCRLFSPESPLNFDLGNKSTITLHHHTRDSHLYYFLQLTVKKYYVIDVPSDYRDYCGSKFIIKACDNLQLNLDSSEIKIVCLTYFDESTLESYAEWEASNDCKLYLLGNFEKNKWTMLTSYWKNIELKHSVIINNGKVFNIY